VTGPYAGSRSLCSSAAPSVSQGACSWLPCSAASACACLSHASVGSKRTAVSRATCTSCHLDPSWSGSVPFLFCQLAPLWVLFRLASRAVAAVWIAVRARAGARWAEAVGLVAAVTLVLGAGL